MLSGPALAQTIRFPNPDRCTSKDLQLVSATLTGTEPCPTCEAGKTVTGVLTIGINNTTGSVRTSFAFWGTLSVKHLDGTTTTSDITACVGPVPEKKITYFDSKNSPQLPGSTSGVPSITYICGETLTLTNLYLAWTDASDGAARQCPLDPSKIAPKCGTLPELVIKTPLTGSAVTTITPCANTNTGSVTVQGAGGTAPYTYSRDGITYVSPVSPATSYTFTGLGAGSYEFYVKDAAGCVTKVSHNLVDKVCCVAPPKPTICQTLAGLCGTGTVSLTISNAVVGDTYYLVRAGLTTLSQVATSSTVTFSGLAPGTGITSVYGTDTQNGTTCTGTSATCNDITTCPATTSSVSNSVLMPDAPQAKEIKTEAYPNPTGRDATINFSVPKSGRVIVQVYNALGAKVATIFDGDVNAGEQRSAFFKGTSLQSGNYTYRVIANGTTKTNRISLIK